MKKPLTKILFVITKGNNGGAQRYVYDLVTHVDRQRFMPIVALGETGILDERLNHAGVRVIIVPAMKNSLSPKQFWLTYKQLWRLFRNEQPDIVHLNSSIAGAAGALAARLARVPKTIFTAHGWAFNEDRPWHHKTIIKFAYWLTIKLSNRTIAVSTTTMAQMDYFGIKNKMKVIHPGRTLGVTYDRNEARGKIVDFFPTLKNHRAEPWLVCIAEFHPIKNHQLLINAFAEVVKKHPRAKLCLIGDGQLIKAIKKQISSLGLKDSVFVIGHLTEASRYIKAFDALILTSLSEAYPYVIQEAGLAGLPVVATDVGGISDIITNTKDGFLIESDDEDSLVAAIDYLLSNKEQAYKLGKKLQTKLSQNDAAHMTKLTEAIYLH